MSTTSLLYLYTFYHLLSIYVTSEDKSRKKKKRKAVACGILGVRPWLIDLMFYLWFIPLRFGIFHTYE